MIANDSDYEADDVPSGLLEGLEQLALELDMQQYPGPAWSLPPVPRPQPRGRRVVAAWKILAGIAIAAGIAFAAITLRPVVTPLVAPPAAVAVRTLAAACPASDKLSEKEKNHAVEHVAAAGIAPLGNEQAIPASDVAESDSPQVVVVEDLDSYSLIDMSGSSPVVSYMSKDASSMEYPVPVPLGSQSPPGTPDRML